MNKHKQAGVVSGLIITLVAFVGVIVALVIYCITAYIHANDYANATESKLKTAKDVSASVLSNGQQKVMEAIQIPDIYRDDLTKIIKTDIEGRYGKDGSRATFQFIKEHALNYDTSLLANVQRMIDVYRSDFERQQKVQMDVKNVYMERIGSVVDGFWIRTAGYPKVNLDDFGPVITDHVAEVFKTGRESGPMKLR